MNKKTRYNLKVGGIIVLILLALIFFQNRPFALDVGATWNNPSWDGYDLRFNAGANIPGGWGADGIIVRYPHDPVGSLTETQCNELNWIWEEGRCIYRNNLNSYRWEHNIKCDRDVGEPSTFVYGFTPEVSFQGDVIIKAPEYSRCVGEVIVHIREKQIQEQSQETTTTTPTPQETTTTTPTPQENLETPKVPNRYEDIVNQKSQEAPKPSPPPIFEIIAIIVFIAVVGYALIYKSLKRRK